MAVTAAHRDASKPPATRSGASRGAIFLDKDGTVLVDVPYNVAPQRMRFAPAVAPGLRLLGQLRMPLIVVSNQPGVALGIFNEHQLKTVGRHLHDMFGTVAAALTAFRWCPHLPDARGRPKCRCRKPKPGLLRAAAVEFDVDLGRSWMIGDILDDVEAGARAGCRTILIDNDNETEWRTGRFREPDHIAPHFGAAARIIAAEVIGQGGNFQQGRRMEAVVGVW